MVKILVVDVSPFADAVDRLDRQNLRDRVQPWTPPTDVELLTRFLCGPGGDEGEALRKFCTYSDNTADVSQWSTFFYDALTVQGWSGVKDDCEDYRTIVKCLRDVGDGFSEPKDGYPGVELVVVLGRVTSSIADLLLMLLCRGFCLRIYLSELHFEKDTPPCVKACAVQLDRSMVSRFVRPAEVPRFIPADTRADDLSGDEADVESHDSDVRSVVDLYGDSDDESQWSDASDCATHNNVSSTRDEEDGGNGDQDQASASDSVASEVSEDWSSEHDGGQTNSSEEALRRRRGSGDGNDDRGYPSDEEGSSDPDADSSTGERSSSSEEDDTDSDDSDPEDNDTTLDDAHQRREYVDLRGVIEITNADDDQGNHDVHEISDSESGAQPAEDRGHREQDWSVHQDVHVVLDEDRGNHRDVIEISDSEEDRDDDVVHEISDSDDESQASEAGAYRGENWVERRFAHEVSESDDDERHVAHMLPHESGDNHQDILRSDDESQAAEAVEYSEKDEDQASKDHLSDDDTTVRTVRLTPTKSELRFGSRDATAVIKGATVEENVRAFSPRFIAILAVVIAVILATVLG